MDDVAREATSGLTQPASLGLQLAAWRQRMQDALAARLPGTESVPTRLHAAMRYSVLGGGKRLRPILLFAAARMLGLEEDDVEAAACAVELVQSYALVHDALPALVDGSGRGYQDDEGPRSRAGCHQAYDEATALLVGDALQPLAFELLATDPALPASPEVRLQAIGLLAEAIGQFGTAGGQAIHLSGRQAAAGSGPAVQRERVVDREDAHGRRTGALLRASVLIAGACAPRLEPALRKALGTFATSLGLAFALLGESGSQERCKQLHAEAVEALEPFGARADLLRELAGWLLWRG